MLQSPEGKLVPPSRYLGKYVPVAEGRELIVDVQVDTRGIADMYIANTIALTVDAKGSDNVKRLEQGTLLAIHCAAMERHKHNPTPS